MNMKSRDRMNAADCAAALAQSWCSGHNKDYLYNDIQWTREGFDMFKQWSWLMVGHIWYINVFFSISGMMFPVNFLFWIETTKQSPDPATARSRLYQRKGYQSFLNPRHILMVYTYTVIPHQIRRNIGFGVLCRSVCPATAIEGLPVALTDWLIQKRVPRMFQNGRWRWTPVQIYCLPLCGDHMPSFE